jgi:hypothetical protein
MKKLVYFTILILLNISVKAQNFNNPGGESFNMDAYQQTSSPPPPPSFGADGPGSPSDAPPSPIDAYTIYLVVIGGILILVFRKRIFKNYIEDDKLVDEVLQ